MMAKASALAVLIVLGSACADPTIDSTTVLAESNDTIGPYRVHSVILGTHPTDKVEVFFNALDNEPAHFIPGPMNPIDDDGRSGEVYLGQIPGQPAGTSIRYYVAVTRDGERVAEDPVGGDLRPFLLEISP